MGVDQGRPDRAAAERRPEGREAGKAQLRQASAVGRDPVPGRHQHRQERSPKRRVSVAAAAQPGECWSRRVPTELDLLLPAHRHGRHGRRHAGGRSPAAGRIRATQAASSQSGTTASATGLAAVGKLEQRASRRCPRPHRHPATRTEPVRRALSIAVCSSCSGVTEALSHHARHDLRGSSCAVERPVGGARAIRGTCAVDGRRQQRTRQLTFRHPLRQAQLD